MAVRDGCGAEVTAAGPAVLARWNAYVAAAERLPLDSADLFDMLAGARKALRSVHAALDAGEGRGEACGA